MYINEIRCYSLVPSVITVGVVILSSVPGPSRISPVLQIGLHVSEDNVLVPTATGSEPQYRGDVLVVMVVKYRGAVKHLDIFKFGIARVVPGIVTIVIEKTTVGCEVILGHCDDVDVGKMGWATLACIESGF
jgi:hypothetical protein